VGTVVAVGLVARRVAGDRAGLIAAALAAFSPVLISADSAVMSETLLGLLVALWLLVAYRPGRGVLLGVLIGLAALTRGEALLLLLAVPFVCRRWRESVVALLACLVVLAPWTVRNLSTFDRPVPISTNEGGLIAGANCGSTYHGHDIGSWDIRCVPHGPPEDESAASARARRAGLDYAGDHLGRVPLVVLARLGRTFELFQPVRQAQQAEGRAAGIEGVGAIFFLLLVPLGAYGALLLRRRGVAPWPLLAPLGIAVAATLIGYGVPRFRHPFDVALTVLAAVALAQLWPRRAQPAREGSQAASAAGPVAPPRSS
jgi:4-amino-4-deoxy-L-arabinose transferase-like glycosyltransferase